jgi:cellulose synthase/poly-beta-1,6-N-acetylglucosamine synthase-like glycosyltransferase
MIGFVELVLAGLFLFFYVGLFYNLPVLVAGVSNALRSRRLMRAASGSRSGGADDADCGCGVSGATEGLPFFSLLVPVKDEAAVVGRLLESLLGVDYPVDRFEVVVVDDESVDGTGEIVGRFAGCAGNVRVLRREFSCGKSNALNFGLRHCRGEIIGVFDADNVVARDVLRRAAGYFADAGVAAVQGNLRSINSGENMLTQFVAVEEAVWCETYLRGKEALGLFVHFRGCCEFVRRGVLESCGGFDEGTLAEDIALSARLTGEGHRIRFAPDCRAWQESPACLGSFLRQRARWFRGHLEVAFRYGRLLERVNRRTVDAEFTLFVPLVAIASLFSYWLASWVVLSAVEFDLFVRAFLVFSPVCTSLLIVLVGFALVFVSRPLRLRSLLWLPFVFGYWCLTSFLALYGALLIVFRRPRVWVKTVKSGVVASPEFALEVFS